MPNTAKIKYMIRNDGKMLITFGNMWGDYYNGYVISFIIQQLHKFYNNQLSPIILPKYGNKSLFPDFIQRPEFKSNFNKFC